MAIILEVNMTAKIITLDSKPALEKTLQCFCDYRITKNYTWNLIFDDLHKRPPGIIFDAACHALSTLYIFPASSVYYGLDICKSRLDQIKNRLNERINVIYGDITKDMNIHSVFDTCVTSRTLSHVSKELRPQALLNIIQTLKQGGNYYVDTEAYLNECLPILAQHFETIEIIYTDHKESIAYDRKGFEENKGVLRSHTKQQMIELTKDYEINRPNTPKGHEGAYLRCINKITSSGNPVFTDRALAPHYYWADNHPTFELIPYENETEEAKSIAQKVIARTRKGVPLHEIMIIVPNNKVSKHITQELTEAAIPHAETPSSESVTIGTPNTIPEKFYDTIYMPAIEDGVWITDISPTERRQTFYALRRRANTLISFTYALHRSNMATDIDTIIVKDL